MWKLCCLLLLLSAVQCQATENAPNVQQVFPAPEVASETVLIPNTGADSTAESSLYPPTATLSSDNQGHAVPIATRDEDQRATESGKANNADTPSADTPFADPTTSQDLENLGQQGFQTSFPDENDFPTRSNDKRATESENAKDSEVFTEVGTDMSGDLSHQVQITQGCPKNNQLPCIAKCCKLDESHVNRSATRGSNSTTEEICIPSVNSQFNPVIIGNPAVDMTLPPIARYEYFIGIPCKNGEKYVLSEMDQPELYANGTLLYDHKLWDMSYYCVENVNDVTTIFFCFYEDTQAGLVTFITELPIALSLGIPLVLLLVVVAGTYLGIKAWRAWTAGYALTSLSLWEP